MLHVPEAVLKHALEYMAESIQEWTKKILWKTAFKISRNMVWDMSISIYIYICIYIYMSIYLYIYIYI